MLLKKLIVFAFFIVMGVECMTESNLSPRQRHIALIASNTAKGDMDELQKILVESLNDKSLTVNEIKEILVQMYAYCGFPRSLNAINAFLSVINDREKS